MSSTYQQRVDAERLERQAQPVKLAARDLRETMKSIEQYLAWSLDPTEKDGGAYFCRNLIDHAHALLDYAHEYRAALTANPPPPEDDDAA